MRYTTMDKDYLKNNINGVYCYAIIALVAALALLGVVAVTTVTIPLLQQQAEAAKSPTGQCASFFKNASAQFCHR